MTYPVKNFHSGLGGAPTLSGTAGALIAVLDACLIDGFNARAVNSVTRVGSEATFVIDGGHDYVDGQILLSAGWDQAEYNGEIKIYGCDATSYKTQVTGTPATPGSGISPTAKVAPIGGWGKSFSATNKAVYRATDPQGTGYYLRVDDSGDKYATVDAYESMSDVDTGTGITNGTAAYWFKSATADAVVKRVGRYWGQPVILFHVQMGATETYLYDINRFGDIVSYRPGDAYHAVITGTASIVPSYPGHYNYGSYIEDSMLTTRAENWIARNHSQLGASVNFGQFALSQSAVTGLGVYGMAFPSPIDGGFYMSGVYVCESAGIRGRMPGLYNPLHAKPLQHLDIIDNVVELPGRELLLVALSYSTNEGRAGFDITGPWR